MFPFREQNGKLESTFGLYTPNATATVLQISHLCLPDAPSLHPSPGSLPPLDLTLFIVVGFLDLVLTYRP